MAKHGKRMVNKNGKKTSHKGKSQKNIKRR